MSNLRLILTLIVLPALLPSPVHAGGPGILLLAHGGSPEWNERVTQMAAEVDRTTPTQVAFGMATRANIQGAIDQLIARGVDEIVAVPLFVSSWSSVIASTEYLLGQRAEAPAALAVFAKMSHSSPGTTQSATAHADLHGAHAPENGTLPVKSSVPIRMTPALNDHPIAAEILTSRARSISRNPDAESVLIVAHGPNDDDQNRRWLADMASHASRVGQAGSFASVDYMTLRDDAPKPVRDQATAALRDLVSRRTREGRRVLVVPLLMSFGGIERGLRERLEGLTYAMPAAGLMPDDRLVDWVLAMAAAR
jgi:hypothetical protein